MRNKKEWLHKGVSSNSYKQKQWTKDQMLAALDTVIKEGLSGNQAAILHDVPPLTLKNRLSRYVRKKPGPAPVKKKKT